MTTTEPATAAVRRYGGKRRVDTYLPAADADRFAELARQDGLTVSSALRRLVLRELRAADQQQGPAR